MVVVVGSVNVDVAAQLDRWPAEGETLPARQGWLAPGGKGGNQAVAAARQGAAVRLVSAVGQDALGALALSTAKAAGVELHVRELPGVPTGMALIWISGQGGNTIVVVRGANAEVVAEQLQGLPSLTAGDVVLISLEIPMAAAVAAAEWGKAGGAQVLVDPAPAPRDLPPALWQADVLMPNRGEAERLLGHPVADGEEVEAARELTVRGAGLGIVKLGSQGLAWSGPRGEGRVAALPVAAVDSTGAGDAFAGALAANLAAGRDVPDALARASQVAAVACMRPGAQTVPTWDEVRAYLASEGARS